MSDEPAAGGRAARGKRSGREGVVDWGEVTNCTLSSLGVCCATSCDAAQQEAERAKYIVTKASQEKEAIIIKAEGEAQSAALVGKVRRTGSSCTTLGRSHPLRRDQATYS